MKRDTWTCKCNCRLHASVCNKKQRWNEDKFRFECKELIDKGICDKDFNWNPSNCECKRDKSVDVEEYLDYKNCKCRKNLVDKLVEECRENIDEKELHQNKMTYNSTLNYYGKICISCTVYKVLFAIFLMLSISISSVFIYFHWYSQRKYIETTIYWIQFYWMQFYWMQFHLTYKWEISHKLILRTVHIFF